MQVNEIISYETMIEYVLKKFPKLSEAQIKAICSYLAEHGWSQARLLVSGPEKDDFDGWQRLNYEVRLITVKALAIRGIIELRSNTSKHIPLSKEDVIKEWETSRWSMHGRCKVRLNPELFKDAMERYTDVCLERIQTREQAEAKRELGLKISRTFCGISKALIYKVLLANSLGIYAGNVKMSLPSEWGRELELCAHQVDHHRCSLLVERGKVVRVHLLADILVWNDGISFGEYEEHCRNVTIELESLRDAGRLWEYIHADIKTVLDYAWVVLNQNPERQPEGIIGESLKYLSNQDKALRDYQEKEAD